MTERIRGRRLQRYRTEWFAEHPLCVHCQAAGRIRLATELDHIISLDKGGPDFDRDDGKNRQGLCHRCHEVKNAADLGYIPAVQNPGGDDSGCPTDPEHSWNLKPRK